jgi:hypothetical protein
MRKKLWSYGGVAASIVLVAFGIASIVVATSGRSEVRSDIKREAVAGTPDMTPQAIKGEAAKAGLKDVALPTCSVANQTIDSGSKAKCFASYMRIHTLEATGGKTYAQLPRYATKDGKGTDDIKAALTNNGQPVNNPLRDLWTQEFALTTALNTSYFAEQVSLFSLVMGIALLLSGTGFLVLTASVLLPATRREGSRTAADTAAATPATSH